VVIKNTPADRGIVKITYKKAFSPASFAVEGLYVKQYLKAEFSTGFIQIKIDFSKERVLGGNESCMPFLSVVHLAEISIARLNSARFQANSGHSETRSEARRSRNQPMT
jgi:ribosomal protein L25 (general stress protein Ctc)